MVPLVGLVVVPLALLAVLAMYVCVRRGVAAVATGGLATGTAVARGPALAEPVGDWFYRPFPGSLPDVVLAAPASRC